MVGVLIRVKLAVLRHSMTGARAAQLAGGALFGLVAMAATIWISLTDYASLPVHSDIMALVLGLWMVGWAIGPLLFTGEDTTLLPEHFRSLPVSLGKLAGGLLSASFVGVPVVISVLAFSALLFYALPLGIGPALVAVPALLLQLGFVVVLSRVVTSVWRTLTTSQLSAALGALVTGAIAAFFSTGWFLFESTSTLTSEGLPAAASVIVHGLPSGWGLAAVEAASQGQWMIVLASLGGLLVLAWSGKLLWANLLEQRLTTKRTQSRPVRHAVLAQPQPASPIRAVIRKELLTWRRDYTRSNYLYFALFFSLAFCLYPVAGDVVFFLPFAGALLALTAAGATANTYASDGTALWMTLTTPKAALSDVRGRQLAWLLIVAPATAILTILLTLFSGYDWIWPWVLALTSAALGAGAGVFVFMSVARLLPMTDPHKRGADAYEHGLDWVQFMLVFLLGVLLAAPAFGITLLGTHWENPLLEWAGVAAGVLSGVLWAWWLGRIAYQRLEAHGPQLLQLMRTGRPSNPTKQVNAKNPLDTLTVSERTLFYACAVIGPVALVPQALVPAVFKLIGEEATRVWFLPLYLPAAWQWPAIALMALIGLAAFAVMAYLYSSHKRT